jgi:hypothetical protein
LLTESGASLVSLRNPQVRTIRLSSGFIPAREATYIMNAIYHENETSMQIITYTFLNSLSTEGVFNRRINSSVRVQVLSFWSSMRFTGVISIHWVSLVCNVTVFQQIFGIIHVKGIFTSIMFNRVTNIALNCDPWNETFQFMLFFLNLD